MWEQGSYLYGTFRSDRKSSRSFLFDPDTMILVGWKNNVTGDVILSEDTLTEDECPAFPFSGIHVMSDKVFGLMDMYVQEKGLEADPLSDDKGSVISVQKSTKMLLMRSNLI